MTSGSTTLQRMTRLEGICLHRKSPTLQVIFFTKWRSKMTPYICSRIYIYIHFPKHISCWGTNAKFRECYVSFREYYLWWANGGVGKPTNSCYFWFGNPILNFCHLWLGERNVNVTLSYHSSIGTFFSFSCSIGGFRYAISKQTKEQNISTIRWWSLMYTWMSQEVSKRLVSGL